MQPVVTNEAYRGTNISTYAQILLFIQQSAGTVYHAAGTCKMGKNSDPLAVLNNKAQVIGVAGLRVVDASAFLILPPGYP